MGILDSLLQIIPSGINAWSQYETNKQNLQLQKEQWKREDESYQRKMADLKAAGLNPVLAAQGGGEASSLTTKLVAPQIDNDVINNALQANVIKQQAARTKADTELAIKQKDMLDINMGKAANEALAERYSTDFDVATFNSRVRRAIAENDAYAGAADFISNTAGQNMIKAASDAARANELEKQAELDTAIKAHDWNIIKDKAVLSNISGLAAGIFNAGNYVGTELNKAGHFVRNAYNQIMHKVR